MDDTLYIDKDLRNQRENAIIRYLGEKTKKYFELRKSSNTINSLEILGISKNKFYEIIDSVPVNLKPNKELKSMLSRLKREFNLIILSNSSKEKIKEITKQLNIQDLFSEIYGGDCFFQVKPAEEAFFMIKEGDICIGNSFKKDLEIPKRKGAITILLSDLQNPEAHYTIRNIFELEQILDTIKAMSFQKSEGI